MMRALRTLIVCALVVAGGAYAIRYINANEPVAERNSTVRRSSMLVDVVSIEVGDYRPVLRALGTVEPAREVTLSALVGGPVVAIDNAFEPGALVSEGTELVSLDASDYRNTVTQRRSALDVALAELRLEEGRRNLAADDLDRLGGPVAEENRELVLREPQRVSAQAAVDSARAALRQAELERSRTGVDAPFDALVLERMVDVGSRVGPGTPVGRVVATDVYWVVATVPQSVLQWLTFPEDGEQGLAVPIANRTAWPEGVTREGRLLRLLGALESDTRLARILIEVHDPLGRAADASVPPVLLGSFVEAELPIREFENVVRLPRELVRRGETTWVMVDRTLEVRELEIVFEDREHAYVRAGLNDGDQVITTMLRTATDGAVLRLADDPPSEPDEAPASGWGGRP